MGIAVPSISQHFHPTRNRQGAFTKVPPTTEAEVDLTRRLIDFTEKAGRGDGVGVILRSAPRCRTRVG